MSVNAAQIALLCNDVRHRDLMIQRLTQFRNMPNTHGHTVHIAEDCFERWLDILSYKLWVAVRQEKVRHLGTMSTQSTIVALFKNHVKDKLVWYLACHTIPTHGPLHVARNQKRLGSTKVSYLGVLNREKCTFSANFAQ